MQTGLVRASQLPVRSPRSGSSRALTDPHELVRETAGIITQLSGIAPVSYAVWMIVAFQQASAAPVAWVGPPSRIPFAPDLIAAGVDLDRLLLARPQDSAGQMTVVDRLLRQELCALSVWDLDPLQPPPPGVLGRFMHLCTRARSALVLLVPGVCAAMAPAVRLHLHVAPDTAPAGLKIEVLRSRSNVESARVDSHFAPGLC